MKDFSMMTSWLTLILPLADSRNGFICSSAISMIFLIKGLMQAAKTLLFVHVSLTFNPKGEENPPINYHPTILSFEPMSTQLPDHR